MHDNTKELESPPKAQTTKNPHEFMIILRFVERKYIADE